MRCNICGGTAFQAAPGERVSKAGRLPRCQSCGSLEHQRGARMLQEELRDVLPMDLMEALHCGDDIGLPRAWFQSLRHVTFADDGRLPEMKDQSIDWITCYHVLDHVRGDILALHELLRVLRPHGVLHLTVPDPMRLAVTEEYGALHHDGQYRIYGRDFVLLLRSNLAGIFLLQLLWADPITKGEELHYFLTPSRVVADSVLELFPSACLEALRGDGKEYSLGQHKTLLADFSDLLPDQGDMALASKPNADGTDTVVRCLAFLQANLGLRGGLCCLGGLGPVRLARLARRAYPGGTWVVAADGPVEQEQDPHLVQPMIFDSKQTDQARIAQEFGRAKALWVFLEACHSAKQVVKQLQFAETLLDPWGLLAISQCFDGQWPEMTEGALFFLSGPGWGRMVPVCLVDGLLLLAQKYHIGLLRDYVRRALGTYALDMQTRALCEQPLICLSMVDPKSLATLCARHDLTQVSGGGAIGQWTGEWHGPARPGRWTGATRSGFLLRLDRIRGNGELFIRVSAMVAPQRSPTHLSLFLDGKEMARGHIHKSHQMIDLSVTLPKWAQVVHVELATDCLASPLELGESKDPRSLGVYFINFDVRSR